MDCSIFVYVLHIIIYDMKFIDDVLILYKFGTFVSCNINFYCTPKNDITRGNIIFQRKMKVDIARNQSAIFVLFYAYCSFKSNNIIIT